MTKINTQKKILISIIIVVVIGIVYLYETRKSNTSVNVNPAKTSDQISPEVNESKITLVGTVKDLNNTDPARYYYELILNFPFYDKLEPTGNLYVNKMPILSRNKVLQDSIKGYVGKEVSVEGLMRWGQGESRYLEIDSIASMSNWKTYTNKAFEYSLKYPTAYQVLGTDNNVSVRKLSSNSNVVTIDIYQDEENISLDDYMNQNSKQLGITGPLLSDRFNGNESLINKNQPGVNQFVKQGLYIYHITASTASQDKEVANIVYTFKFKK